MRWPCRWGGCEKWAQSNGRRLCARHFTIYDSYGDGICCSYGNGSYTLTDYKTNFPFGLKNTIVDKKDLKKFNPPFIDVTSHSSSAQKFQNGQTVLKRKRPGTISICGIIQNRFNIDTVAHLVCNGFTKEETEDALIELSFLGITNILAISGDGNPKKIIQAGKSINKNSLELIHQIKNLSQGDYLHEIANSSTIDMCMGVGCYPEQHAFSSDFDQEIDLLKQKRGFKNKDWIIPLDEKINNL